MPRTRPLVLALAATLVATPAAAVAATGSIVRERAITAPPAASTAPAAPTAHAAALTGVRIVDFAFDPASVTVDVGDTISWTNEDAAPHTATATDGSFDTGTLNRGQSGSHTFTTPGTFAYYCSIHASMRGTVTVIAASVAPADAATPAASTPLVPPAPAASLPNTGANVVGLALTGLGLLLGGVLLRAFTRPAARAKPR